MENNQIISHHYNRVKIDFVQRHMEKQFGEKKNLGQWLKLKKARTLILAVMTQNHIPEDQLVIKNMGVGEKEETWLYEFLAKEFARWLSMDFYLWTIQMLKEMIKARIALDNKVKYRSMVLEFRELIDANLNEEIKEINKMEKGNNHIPIVF